VPPPTRSAALRSVEPDGRRPIDDDAPTAEVSVSERLDRAREVLADQGAGALLVGPGADLSYLTGHHAPPLERLTLLVVTPDEAPVLVLPELEAPLAAGAGVDEHVRLVPWGETTDPVALVTDHLRSAGAAASTLAVQDRLWSVFTLALQDALPEARWRPGSTVMRELRLRKEPAEIAALHAVGAAIDRVHGAVPDLLRAGRTEAEVARDLDALIREEHDEVNFIIVGSGPNGASPHHDVGDRRLEPGDAVVVDIGGTRAGYCSDMTRDYAVEHLPDGYAELHEVLERAQQAAVEAVAPGVSAESVDRAARRVITDAGYGERFIHRTGHGIGIEEHEEPWIVEGNTQVLEEGMAFSVEPGIYVPGTYGARIEDIVVVTDEGADRCNHRPREVVVCG
jgi:Xaa-Pro aminopeptidase